MFARGLGISCPWKIVNFEFVDGEVHIHVDFERGARFDGHSVHDTCDRVWRHLNFFKYACYIHARVPRVRGEDGKVRTVPVPWGRVGSGFTLDFEALAVRLMTQMPVKAVARELGVADTRLWRVLNSFICRSRVGLDLSKLCRVGVDETAARRGHNYITVFADLDERRTIFACEGRSSVALAQFRRFLEGHQVPNEQIREFTCDMSPAYLSGIEQAFPNARITLDKYHLVAMINRAVDFTRRDETATFRNLRKTRYLWLRNPESLSAAQKLQLRAFMLDYGFSMTANAYALRLQFQDIFHANQRVATKLFDAWLDNALESENQHIARVAESFFRLREQILNWFQTRISNGILEGFHSVIQATKNKARG
ncbi:MAG: ISL3 family transposase, partial [Terriglobia bacterium]